MVEFAVSKHVKILALDFLDSVSDIDDLVRLPPCVYDQTTIESLNLSVCYVKPSEFKKQIEALRSLDIGQLDLQDLTTLHFLCHCNCYNIYILSCCFGKMIPHDEEDLYVYGTRHLVMKTNIHPYEFMGINLMINNCKVLEYVTRVRNCFSKVNEGSTGIISL